MKLSFKCNAFGIVMFVLFCGIFYRFCPLPTHPLWRILVCSLAVLVFAAMCFVVVTQKGPIKPSRQRSTRRR